MLSFLLKIGVSSLFRSNSESFLAIFYMLAMSLALLSHCQMWATSSLHREGVSSSDRRLVSQVDQRTSYPSSVIFLRWSIFLSLRSSDQAISSQVYKESSPTHVQHPVLGFFQKFIISTSQTKSQVSLDGGTTESFLYNCYSTLPSFHMYFSAHSTSS